MKDLGPAGRILDMRLGSDIDKSALLLSQKRYLENVVDKFFMKVVKLTKQHLTN